MTTTVHFGSTPEDETALQTAVHSGRQIEDISEMTDRYYDVLVNTMHIAADLEVATLPAYISALEYAPTLEDRVAITTAIQDELGHAQVMFRMLEDFGYDTYELIFERDPGRWRTNQILEFPNRDYIETVVNMCYGDRAGYITTTDLEKNCSFGPYARSLSKVNFEEKFHVAHGEKWVRFFWNHSEESRRRVQECVDFTFPLAVMWFGVPDDYKKRTDQLTYRIRGASNDQMRQAWLAQVVPFSESVGIKVPAHFDPDLKTFVLDYELPAHLDQENRKWDLTRTIDWKEQFAIWKRGTQWKRPMLGRLGQQVWGDELW